MTRAGAYAAAASESRIVSSTSRSTGFARCSSKPAASARRRSSGTAVARKRDEAQPPRRRVAAQPAGELVAIHLRQADVDQGDIERERAGLGDGLVRSLRRVHLVAVEPQERGEGFARVGVVFDDEDGSGRPLARRAVLYTGQRAWTFQRGQDHGERRAFAGPGAGGADGSAVQLDQALRHGETDAEAALLAREAAIALHE